MLQRSKASLKRRSAIRTLSSVREYYSLLGNCTNEPLNRRMRGSMTKTQGTVRQRILDYLATYGEVTDASGRSTAVLTEALGLPADRVGTVSAMLTALANDGLIERDLEHRRCFSIRLAGHAVEAAALVPQELDYAQLAKALLEQVFETMAEADRLSEELERVRDVNGRLKAQLDLAEKRAAQRGFIVRQAR